MSEKGNDFCKTGDCPDVPISSDAVGYDLSAHLTPDLIAHVEAGGSLRVTDTRRGVLKQFGKLAGVLGVIGVLGKLTIEKADAATCAALSCPGGKYYLGYYQNRYAEGCPAGYTYSCWRLYRCWHDTTYYSDVWCRDHCGHC